MVNIVATQFIGDPTKLFQAADAVEARLALLSRRVAQASALPMTVRAQDLTARELTALNNLQTRRNQAERAYTALYISQLRLREAAELAMIRRVGTARAASLSGSTVAGAAGSRVASTAAAAGVGGAFAAGLAPVIGAGIVAAAGLTVKASVTEYEAAQKKQLELKSSTAELQKQLADLFAARGIEADRIPGILENLNSGLADAAVFGKNGAAVLEVYAARLGRTAESLTEAERQQALLNEAMLVSARNAGAASLRVSELEASSAELGKTWKSMLVTLGGFTTPAVASILQFINQVAGGQAPLSPAAQAEKDLQESVQRQQEYLRQFQTNQRDYAAALANPNANLFNFSVTRFGDRSKLLGGNLDAAAEERNAAVERGKEYVESFIKGVRANIQISSVSELRDLAKQVFDARNLLSFDQWRAVSQEIQRAIAESVDAGRKKVAELTEGYRNLFDSILQRSNSGNPFVAMYSEGEKALESFRQKTVGLDADLRAQGEALIRQQQQLARYGLRIDTAFAALDLREDARRFRSTPQADQLVAKAVFDRIVAGNIGRDQLGGTFGSFLADSVGGAENLSDVQRRSIFEVALLGNASSGLNRGSLASVLARERLANPLENLSAQERLDRQLQLLEGFRPRSAEEMAVADTRLIGLSRGLNPEELRADQREKIASALERQAERTERREQEALDVQKQMLRFSESIDANQKRLLAIAERGGIQGVEAAITIRDETAAGVDVSRRGSPGDVAARYDLTQRGPGGLSNF